MADTCLCEAHKAASQRTVVGQEEGLFIFASSDSMIAINLIIISSSRFMFDNKLCITELVNS